MKTTDEYIRVTRKIASLRDLVNTSVQLYGEKEAYLIKKEKGGAYQSISYHLLEHDINALGTQLTKRLAPNAKVALIGENCYEWMVSYLAIVNSGRVVVPLDKELTEREIQNLANVAECTAAFFTERYRAYFENLDIHMKVEMKVYGDRTDIREVLSEETIGPMDTWESLVAKGEKALSEGVRTFLDMDIDIEKMSMLLFTSGTMGDAKGVMLSHKNIAYNVYQASLQEEMYPQDRCLSILPIHHALECGIGNLYMLYNGSSIAFCEGLRYVSKNLQECSATVILVVPLILESIYSKIWKEAKKTGKEKTLRFGMGLSRRLKKLGIDKSRLILKSVHDKMGGRLRMIVTGAAPVDPNVLRGFMDFGIQIVHGYGLTECSPLLAASPTFLDNYKKAGSVGTAMQDGELKIENRDERGIGEIVYRGPNVMLGYYKQPEMTSQVIRDGWFYTGDLGFLDEEGWLYITGREKNVIVTKTGKNVYPEELETVLNRCIYIEESLVYGLEETDDTTVSAIVKPDYDMIYEQFGDDFKDEDIQKLIQEAVKDMNEELAIYKRIRNVKIRREEFIKTTTKKIKRSKNL